MRNIQGSPQLNDLGSTLIEVVMGFSALMLVSGLLADLYISSHKSIRTSADAENFQLMVSKIQAVLSHPRTCAMAFGVGGPPGNPQFGKGTMAAPPPAPMPSGTVTPVAPAIQWPLAGGPNGLQLDYGKDVINYNQPYAAFSQQILNNPLPGANVPAGTQVGISLQPTTAWDPNITYGASLPIPYYNYNGLTPNQALCNPGPPVSCPPKSNLASVSLMPAILTVSATSSLNTLTAQTVRSASFYVMLIVDSGGTIQGCMGQGAQQMIQAELCAGYYQPWGGSPKYKLGTGILTPVAQCSPPTPSPITTNTQKCN